MEIKQRFLNKVDITENCWNWTASLNRHGYSQFQVAGKIVRAHRFSFELFKGEIPAGLHVCHTCDNRKCCNPDHLFLGTHAENMADRNRKNRQARQKGTDHGRCKLTEEQVREIRQRYATGNFSLRELAKQFGVDHTQIYFIINRKGWKHI